MKERIGDEQPSSNGRANAERASALAGNVPSAREEAGSQALVLDGDYLQPSVPRSNYGKVGEIAKRVVARLIRFYTHEQNTVNETLRSEVRHLRARLAVVEAASQQRFAANERELIELRRDLSETANDFARIAERVLVFENVRRTVARMAPFRDEVRSHRREIIELHQRFAAVSARLTLVQREIAPVRRAADQLRGEVDSALATAHAGFDTALATLRTGLTGEHEALRKRSDTIFESLRREATALSTAIAEHGARLSGVVADLARLANYVDDERPFQRVAEIEARIAELAEGVKAFPDGFKSITQADARMADIAGAVNSLADDFNRERHERERLIAALRADTPSSVVARDDITEIAKGLNDVAQRRIGDIAGRMDVIAAELSNLGSRVLATPYVSTPLSAWTPARLSTADDFDYLGFEDVFRGPEELVRERLRVYLPLLAGHAPIVELGSGRGEFLELMRDAKRETTGVDINADAVARCHAKGLTNLVQSDANTYLASLEEGTVGAIFSAQFAEHLNFTDLLRCLTLSRSRLVAGGLFIAETVNPNSVEAAKTFYVDLSHDKPLFPEVFTFLCRSVGFTSVRVFYPTGNGFDEADTASKHEYAVVATA